MSESNRADRAYLLGDLAPQEAERVELEVMADQAVADRLIAAENDLIDEYVEGSLGGIERQKFEAAFLSIPARADRVRLAQELVERASTREDVRARWRPQVWAGLLIAATLVIAVAVWVVRGPAGEPQLASGTPPSSQPPTNSSAGTPSPERRTLPFVLTITSTRGAAVPSMVIAADIEDLAFQIDVAGESRFPGFDARITGTGDVELWKSTTALVPSADGVLTVLVPVSAGIGLPGTYELTLMGRPAAGEPRLLGAIPFVVRRP